MRDNKKYEEEGHSVAFALVLTIGLIGILGVVLFVIVACLLFLEQIMK